MSDPSPRKQETDQSIHSKLFSVSSDKNNRINNFLNEYFDQTDIAVELRRLLRISKNDPNEQLFKIINAIHADLDKNLGENFEWIMKLYKEELELIAKVKKMDKGKLRLFDEKSESSKGSVIEMDDTEAQDIRIIRNRFRPFFDKHVGDDINLNGKPLISELYHPHFCKKLYNFLKKSDSHVLEVEDLIISMDDVGNVITNHPDKYNPKLRKDVLRRFIIILLNSVSSEGKSTYTSRFKFTVDKFMQRRNNVRELIGHFFVMAKYYAQHDLNCETEMKVNGGGAIDINTNPGINLNLGREVVNRRHPNLINLPRVSKFTYDRPSGWFKNTLLYAELSD